MKYIVDGLSLGLEGRNNQDAWSIRQDGSNRIVIAVADGVGGHLGGAVAAKIAVDKATERLHANHHSDFEQVFRHICIEIEKQSTNSLSEQNMATTLSIVSILGNEARFGHVGDSRIYHLRDHGLIQLTEDQTEAALLVKEGIISPMRAKNYKRRSVLTSSLSARGDFTVNTGKFSIMPHDRLILLTDGAYRKLLKKTLRDISVSNKNWEAFTVHLHEAISAEDLHDDATIVAIEAEAF